ncbi:MAG: hypothetical protein IT446_05070 [Phycisphaerales bacterium]|nr:hypothetical protein [Phycisphaerales bacterium]
MRKRFKLIGILPALIALLQLSPVLADQPVSRGRQLLLERGLQIHAMTFFDQPGVKNIDIDRFRNANFTAINLWETQNPKLRSLLPADMPWSREYIPGKPPTYLFPDELPYLDQLVSLQYADEIQDFSPRTIRQVAEAFADWKKNYPRTLAYTNFGGPTGYISDTDLREFMNLTRPDMLSFDIYPYRFGMPVQTWYTLMQLYRTAALGGYTVDGQNSGPLPYAQFVYTALGTPDTPLQTQSYIRLQQNASWAFGYTFITAYFYNAWNDANRASMFKGMGDAHPTPLYDYVRETNRQSLNLGPALVRLLSTDVRIMPGRIPNDNPKAVDGDPKWIPDRLNSTRMSFGHRFITRISTTNLGDINYQVLESGKKKPLPGDVLLGYFKTLENAPTGPDADQEAYFMVVNGLIEEENAPAADTRQRIHLSFDFKDSNINSLQRLSRQTGKVEVVPLIHDQGGVYHLDLTLKGGEGDLFKFNTGKPFVSESH